MYSCDGKEQFSAAITLAFCAMVTWCFRNYSNMQILCPGKIIVLLLLIFMLKPLVQLSIFLEIMIAYFFSQDSLMNK